MLERGRRAYSSEKASVTGTLSLWQRPNLVAVWAEGDRIVVEEQIADHGVRRHGCIAPESPQCFERLARHRRSVNVL